MNTRDTRFILIVDGSPCLEREIRMINICHIVTGVVKRTLTDLKLKYVHRLKKSNGY